MKLIRTHALAFVVGLVLAGSVGWVATATAQGGAPWARLVGNNAFDGNNVFNHATAPGETGFEVNDNAAVEGVGVFATSNSVHGVGLWGNYGASTGGFAGAGGVRGDSNSPDAPGGFFQTNALHGVALRVAGLHSGFGFEVYEDGSAWLQGALTQNSSERFKDNITPLEGALDAVSQIRGVSFDWKDNGRHDIGVIAEEVAAVLPELVSEDGATGEIRGVDYGRLSAVLIEAVKEQQEQIRELKRALDRIEAGGR